MILNFSYSEQYGSQCKRVEMVGGRPVTVAYKPAEALEILSGDYNVRPRATVFTSKDGNFKIVVVDVLEKIKKVEQLTAENVVVAKTIPLGTTLEVEFSYGGHGWKGEVRHEGHTFTIVPKQIPYFGPAPNGVRPRFSVRVSENLPKRFYEREHVKVELVEEIKTKRGKRFTLPYQQHSAVSQ